MEKSESQLLPENRIGIDFGRNITVIAASHGSCNPAKLVAVPGISREVPGSGGGVQIPIIPSAIRFQADGSCFVGEEAVSPGIPGRSHTFQRMVYYLCQNSPVLVPDGSGRSVSYPEAGAGFLNEIIKRAREGYDNASVQVTLTRPIGAPPQYEDWISGVAEAAGMRSVSTIDAGYAVVRGYDLPFDNGELYVIVDANTDYLEVSVIVPENEAGISSSSHSRILGMASADYGGLCVDSWIAAEILSTRGGIPPGDRQLRLAAVLRHRCQRGREALSAMNETPLNVGDLVAGRDDHTTLTTAGITEIFREHGLFTLLDRALSRAVSAASKHGYEYEDITAILMTGELSSFPPLHSAVCGRFSPIPVRFDHALDAAARGAVNPDASRKLPIRADYALRYWDPASREHRFRLLVRRGTSYPSSGQVARVLISASFDGQTCLGIPLCRITGEDEIARGKGLELVVSPAGGFRLASPVADFRGGGPVQVNKSDPLYLPANPPAQKGVPRFDLIFTVDGQGYLCLTARDILTGALVEHARRILCLVRDNRD